MITNYKISNTREQIINKIIHQQVDMVNEYGEYKITERNERFLQCIKTIFNLQHEFKIQLDYKDHNNSKEFVKKIDELRNEILEIDYIFKERNSIIKWFQDDNYHAKRYMSIIDKIQETLYKHNSHISKIMRLEIKQNYTFEAITFGEHEDKNKCFQSKKFQQRKSF